VRWATSTRAAGSWAQPVMPGSSSWPGSGWGGGVRSQSPAHGGLGSTVARSARPSQCCWSTTHPAASRGAGVGGQQLLPGAEREDRDLGWGDAAVRPGRRGGPAARPPRSGWPKPDQRVGADPAGVPVADHIGLLGQPTQRGPVAFGPDPGDLAVGAVDLRAADRQPGGERGVQLDQRGEPAAGEHVAAHDPALTFHPALGLGSVGGGQPDREVVVAGERDRLGTGAGWAAHGRHAGAPPSWSGRRRSPPAPRVRWANARRWQSQNVPRSWLAVKQQNGSREYASVMWKLDTRSGPVAVWISPSSPQSTWACAPGSTSNRRWKPAGS